MRAGVPALPWDHSSPTPTCRTAVHLNVYDIVPANDYLYWIGLGVFHSGIEINGVEYAFGAHESPTSGIFEVEPRNWPGFTFRRSISLGATDMSPLEFKVLIDRMSSQYTGDSYNLLTKNCNHFTNDVCMKLTGRPLPGWVNRLANVGSLCSCVLPDMLQNSSVQPLDEYNSSEDVHCARTGQEQSDLHEQDQLLLVPPSRGMRLMRQDQLQNVNLNV